jgi:hypothetical protein
MDSAARHRRVARTTHHRVVRFTADTRWRWATAAISPRTVPATLARLLAAFARCPEQQQPPARQRAGKGWIRSVDKM